MEPQFEQSYFETNYRDYFAQNPPAKVGRYVDIVRQYLPAGGLLEIGCAFGVYAEALSSFLTVVATDVSSYAVDRARGRPGASRVVFRTGKLEDFDFPAASFDGVAAFDVLEHIPDIDGSLVRLRALLKPGGLLFLTVPVYDGPLGPIVRLLDRDPTHVHKWGRDRWRQLAERHGFRVVERVGMLRYGIGKQYLFFAHPLLAPVGSALFLVLRRAAEGERQT
jgi:SAM-dependent methyltransferase